MSATSDEVERPLAPSSPPSTSTARPTFKHPCLFPGCPKGFSRRDHLERHQLNHAEKSHVCNVCSRGFVRADVLKRHVEGHLKNADRTSQSNEPQPPPSKRRRTTTQPPVEMSASSSSRVPSSNGVEHPPQAVVAGPPPTPDLSITSFFTSTPSNFPLAPPAGSDFQTSTSVSSSLPASSSALPGWCFPSASFSRSSTPVGAIPSSQLPISNIDDMLSWLFNSPGKTPEQMATVFPSLDGGGLDDGGGGGGGGQEAESSLMALVHVALPTQHNFAPHEGYLQEPAASRSSEFLVQGSPGSDAGEIVTEEKRREVLALGDGVLAEDLSTTFSLNSMRIFLDLYFMHFAPLHPILHQSTLALRPGGISPYLLAAVCCIGSAYAEEKSGWKAAVRLSKRLRNRILEIVEENPRIDMDMLKTLMLVNWFGRYFCSATLHDVSQVFHSSSIILAGFSGVLVPEDPPDAYDSTLDGWCSWAVAEERRRLAWFVFLSDTSNAALFRQYLMVHCYYLEVPFPSSDSLWHASSVHSWKTQYDASALGPKEMSFRDALRLLVGKGQIVPELNDFSLWIMLHGLISICWTLLWRDLGDLSMVHESKITGWKDSLRLAFGFWQTFASNRFVARTSAGWDPLEMSSHWAGISLCNTGVILLLSETDLIRVCSGAKEVAGRIIAPHEREAANTKLLAWARSRDGQYSCKAALELLKQMFSWASEARFQTGPSTTPWCIYIATLTVWAFTTLLDGRTSLVEPSFISTTPLSPEPRIEPSLARKAAILYCSRLLAAPTLDDLARVPGKNRCGAVLAYTAFLCGMEDRGIMSQPRASLIDLLMGRT